MGVASGRGFDWGSLHVGGFGFPCERYMEYIERVMEKEREGENYQMASI